jgi:beta-lactam-binding protein with PASTA domain
MDQALADGQPNPGFTEPNNDAKFGKAIPVPSVAGQDQATATATLPAAGFQVTVGGTTNSDVTAGSVVSQSPSGAAPAGSTITLTLSNGQPATPGAQPGPGGGNGQGNNGQGNGQGNNP